MKKFFSFVNSVLNLFIHHIADSLTNHFARFRLAASLPTSLAFCFGLSQNIRVNPNVLTTAKPETITQFLQIVQLSAHNLQLTVQRWNSVSPFGQPRKQASVPALKAPFRASRPTQVATALRPAKQHLPLRLRCSHCCVSSEGGEL